MAQVAVTHVDTQKSLQLPCPLLTRFICVLCGCSTGLHYGTSWNRKAT